MLYYRLVSPYRGKTAPYTPKILTFARQSGNVRLHAKRALKFSTLHFNAYKALACKLTPLTGGPLIFVRWVTLMPEMGGLKGEMAPGDAHPYLAPFYNQNLSA